MTASKAGSDSSGTSSHFRIAHLSDIHFGHSFDPPVWTYVCQVLKSDPPDLLLITGDVVDSPGILNLMLARRQIEELASEATKTRKPSAFRIIPGNHDVALLGNIKVWPTTRFFDLVFEKLDRESFATLPTYTGFLSRGRIARLKVRLEALAIFCRCACKHWRSFLTRTSASVCRPDDTPEVFIACLNSNAGLRLATGRVSEFEVAALKGAVMSLTAAETPDTRSFAPRIAMLHHHAMAIPYSDGKEGLTSFEPFLVLRNSGTLLRELCRQDFDLVLHGHKHFSSFSRVSFSHPDELDGEMSIIAAGSAGIALPEEGRNSINLIDISKNGQIAVERCTFGNGESPETGHQKSMQRRRLLFDMEGLKRRAFRRAVEAQQRLADRLYREVRINEFGSSQGEIGFDGFRVLGKSKVSYRDILLSTDIGMFMPESVRADETSIRAGLRFSANHPPPQGGAAQPEGQPGGNARKLLCRFDLSSAMLGATEGLHYGIAYESHTSYRISAWESLLSQADSAASADDPAATDPTMMPATEPESLSVLLRYPCRKLVLRLSPPPNLVNRNIRLTIQRPVSYPILGLEDGDVARSDLEYETDTDMICHEQKNLRPLDDKTWELTIAHPMVGYRYGLEWDVLSKEDTQADPHAIGRAMAIRRVLLHAANESWRTQLRELLGLIQSDLRERFGSQYAEDECISICIHVLDTTTRTLRLIAHTPGSDTLRSHCAEVPWAFGVRGSAAKMRQFVFYIAPQLRNRSYRGTRLYAPHDRTPRTHPRDYAVLCAHPLMLPRTDESRTADAPPPLHELLGVISLGSDASDSGLIGLLPSGTNSDTAIQKFDDQIKVIMTHLGLVQSFICEKAQAKNRC